MRSSSCIRTWEVHQENSFLTTFKDAKNASAGEIKVFSTSSSFTKNQLVKIRTIFMDIGKTVGLSQEQLDHLLIEIVPFGEACYFGERVFSKNPYFPTIRMSENQALALFNRPQRSSFSISRYIEKAIDSKNEKALKKSLGSLSEEQLFSYQENYAYSASEVKSVIAHEMGHYLFRCKEEFFLSRKILVILLFVGCGIGAIFTRSFSKFSLVFGCAFTGYRMLEKKEESFADRQVLKEPSWVVAHNQMFERARENRIFLQNVFFTSISKRVFNGLFNMFTFFSAHPTESARILKI